MPTYHLRDFDPSLPFPALVKDCDMIMALVEGDKAKIQTYLDAWFMDGCDQQRRVTCLTENVFVAINYGRVGVEGNTSGSFGPWGSADYAESALVVPVLLNKRFTFMGMSLMLPIGWGWDMSYIFASNLLAVLTTRDVWGYSKTLGSVKKSSSSSFSEVHRVKTDTLEQPGANEVWKRRQLYSLSRYKNPLSPLIAPTQFSSAFRTQVAVPFANHDCGLARLVLDNRGGQLWLDDPRLALDTERLVAELPTLEISQTIGPDGPLERVPDFRPADVLPFEGISADERLLEQLSTGDTSGAALLSLDLGSLLPSVPTPVLGLKQERRCEDPALAEHRQLVVGEMSAHGIVAKSIEGPGSWYFRKTLSPASHDWYGDLGIKSQKVKAAVRSKLDMVIGAGKVEWSA